MMVLDKTTGKIEHRKFDELLDYFDEKDLFVFNDTKSSPHAFTATRRKQVHASKSFSCVS